MAIFQIFIPIFILSAFSAVYISGVRLNLNKETKSCVEVATSIQVKHRDITKSLLTLNPYAKSLRFKRRSAEIAYRTAPPHAKPPALAHLKRVKMQQKIFRYKQNRILQNARRQSIVFRKEIYSKGFKVNPSLPKLKLYKYPLLSDSPSYKLKPNYTKLKKVLMKKKIYTHSFIPQILLKILKIKNIALRIDCGSTLLERGGVPYKIKLATVK